MDERKVVAGGSACRMQPQQSQRALLCVTWYARVWCGHAALCAGCAVCRLRVSARAVPATLQLVNARQTAGLNIRSGERGRGVFGRVREWSGAVRGLQRCPVPCMVLCDATAAPRTRRGALGAARTNLRAQTCVHGSIHGGAEGSGTPRHARCGAASLLVFQVPALAALATLSQASPRPTRSLAVVLVAQRGASRRLAGA